MHGLDGDFAKGDAQPLGQHPRVLPGVIRAVSGRHGHAGDAFRPERHGRHRRGERAVDAARDPDDRGPEATLPHVVANPEDERLEYLVGLSVGRRPRRTWRGEVAAVECQDAHVASVEVGDEQHLLEEGRPRQDPAIGPDQHRAAVEDERVVPAHLVHVGDRRPVGAGRGAEHSLPELRFPQRVGGRRDVHHQFSTTRDQVGDGVALVAGVVPEALVVPDVLADREAEPEPHRPGRRSRARRRRQEVAGLVEDVVGGEQRFPPHRCDPAILQQRHRVVEAGGRCAGRALREAEGHPDPARPPGRSPQLLDRGGAAGHELGHVEEVARRVARDGQLREGNQVGPRVPGPPGDLADLARIAVEVPDGGVDLGQGDPLRGHGREW